MNIPVHYDPSIGTRRQGYNLGDILNMPVFWSKWTSFKSLHDLSVVASQLPQTIAGLYYNCRTDGLGAVSDDPLIPHRPRLLCAVNEYIAAHPELRSRLKSLKYDDSVLCIHVRSGDYGPVSHEFFQTVECLSKRFAKVVVLSGVHCNGDDAFVTQNKTELNECLDRIRTLVPHAVFDFNEPDVHVCYMAKACNLLVHRGGFSILGTLVFSGKHLYVTPDFQPLKKKKNNELWHKLQIPHQITDPHLNDNQMPTAPTAPMPTASTPIVKKATSWSIMQMKPQFATKGIANIIPPRNKFSKNIGRMRLMN